MVVSLVEPNVDCDIGVLVVLRNDPLVLDKPWFFIVCVNTVEQFTDDSRFVSKRGENLLQKVQWVIKPCSPAFKLQLLVHNLRIFTRIEECTKLRPDKKVLCDVAFLLGTEVVLE